MPIFKVSGGKLKKLNALTLDKEKSLQALVEANLTESLGLLFLASEYPTTLGGRIDTLAVDMDGAPVIIEYKRNKNDTVINQALSYLKWLKTQKAGFFEKLMFDKLGKDVAEKIKLDWQNPRVICIAESYSKFDIDTVEVVPLRIELFRYRYYEGDVFSLDPLNMVESTAPVQVIADSSFKKSTGESSPSVELLRNKAVASVKELFDQLREEIMALDEAVIEKPTALYVGYRISNNFVEIHIGKNQLRIHLRPIDYVDPKGMVEKIPEGYNWTMDRRVYLKSAEDLEYVMGLIEQSYKNVL